ncbi:MAG TPA: tyrosine-type recombinase/integrase [Anaerohalosphaeraceae bacterium]|nr:tyrosine-type recombinase/integrase [Anaerohalosphaeraceae bacterium]
MASIGKKQTKAGARYYVQLSPGENSQRPKIFLGSATVKQAETAKVSIERILLGEPFPESVKKWLSDIKDESIIKRMETLGLIEPQDKYKWTVSAWVADYISKRTDVKPKTLAKWRDVEKKLKTFFKDDLLGKVTAQQAFNFQTYLKSTIGLNDCSVRRAIGFTRQFFTAAVNDEIISKNPFKGKELPVTVIPDDSRFFEVTRDIAQKVLDACPNAEFRLLFGLARFGGLRCPSEVLSLKWADIDWEKKRFTVHSPKTERYPGKGKRIVPMFPELKPLFRDAFDEAKEGSVYCIEFCRKTGSDLNLYMGRVLKRAGLEPWEKFFVNCRATRETELLEMTHNIKAVARWLGHSEAIALRHYAKITESAMQKAAEETVLKKGEEIVEKKSAQTEPAEIGGYNQHQPTPEIVGNCENQGSDNIDVNPLDCNDLPAISDNCPMLDGNPQTSFIIF